MDSSIQFSSVLLRKRRHWQVNETYQDAINYNMRLFGSRFNGSSNGYNFWIFLSRYHFFSYLVIFLNDILRYGILDYIKKLFFNTFISLNLLLLWITSLYLCQWICSKTYSWSLKYIRNLPITSLGPTKRRGSKMEISMSIIWMSCLLFPRYWTWNASIISYTFENLENINLLLSWKYSNLLICITSPSKINSVTFQSYFDEHFLKKLTRILASL